jgi:DNA-binding NtrC family response regulator
MSGLEAAKRLKKFHGRLRGLKIFIASGSAGMEDVISALRLGVVDFFEKPVDPHLMLYTVGRSIQDRAHGKIPSMTVDV